MAITGTKVTFFYFPVPRYKGATETSKNIKRPVNLRSLRNIARMN